MIRSPLLLAALVALPLAAAAQAPDPPPSPAAIVGERQSLMSQGGGDLAALKKAADAGDALETLAPRIERLVRWSETLPGMFPEGSNVSSSGARDEVWSDRAGFEAKAAAFATAVRALAAAATAGDRAVFLARWTEARATCAGCHNLYKN
jgi:cytochrome c556